MNVSDAFWDMCHVFILIVSVACLAQVARPERAPTERPTETTTDDDDDRRPDPPTPFESEA